MMKFTKLGATALAMALSITLVAPIGANAAYKNNVPDTFSDRYEGITETSQIKENKDASGNIVSYTDITTGKTVTEEADLVDYKIPKKIQIPVKEWTELTVKVGGGSCEIKKVKSSSKGTIKAKLSKSYKQYKTDNKEFCEKDKDGRLYYTDPVTQKKVYVANEDAAPNASEGTYTIRLYALKEGTSTVSYEVYDNKGAKVKKVKVKVTAKEIAPFASVTFAGKSLLVDKTKGATNANTIGEDKYVDSYTTKKSGKVRIKMSKGYKLVKVITGTENDYKIEPDTDYVAPAYGEKIEQIRADFKSDWGKFSNYYTWTDRGTKKNFKLKLSSNPISYEYTKFGRTGDKGYDYTNVNKSQFSYTPIFIYFVDKNTKKLYCFHTNIKRLLEK